MQPTDLKSIDLRNERLAVIVESCLGSPAAYKLFDVLAQVAALDLDARIEYIDLVRESGAYTEEEIEAIERLIISGAAKQFMDVIEHVRQEQVQREINDLVVATN